mgnify:CR=1 FL=1
MRSTDCDRSKGGQLYQRMKHVPECREEQQRSQNLNRDVQCHHGGTTLEHPHRSSERVVSQELPRSPLPQKEILHEAFCVRSVRPSIRKVSLCEVHLPPRHPLVGDSGTRQESKSLDSACLQDVVERTN